MNPDPSPEGASRTRCFLNTLILTTAFFTTSTAFIIMSDIASIPIVA